MFQTPSLYRTPAVAMLVSQLFASRADPLKSSKKNMSPSVRALFLMGRGRPSAPKTSTTSRNTGFPIMAILLGGDAGRDPVRKNRAPTIGGRIAPLDGFRRLYGFRIREAAVSGINRQRHSRGNGFKFAEPYPPESSGGSGSSSFSS